MWKRYRGTNIEVTDEGLYCEYTGDTVKFISIVNSNEVEDWKPSMDSLVVVDVDGANIVISSSSVDATPKDSDIYPLEELLKQRYYTTTTTVTDNNAPMLYLDSFILYNNNIYYVESDDGKTVDITNGIDRNNIPYNMVEGLWRPEDEEPVYVKYAKDAEFELDEFNSSVTYYSVIPVIIGKRVFTDLGLFC